MIEARRHVEQALAICEEVGNELDGAHARMLGDTHRSDSATSVYSERVPSPFSIQALVPPTTLRAFSNPRLFR